MRVVLPVPGGHENPKYLPAGSSINLCIFVAIPCFPSNTFRRGHQNLALGSLKNSHPDI